MPWKKESQFDRKALEDTTITNNKTGPWWSDRGLRKLNFLLFFLLFSEYTQGYDASLINNVQQLKVWQKGLMSSAYWVGNVCGVVLISLLSDRYGRRVSMGVGCLLCLLGTGLGTAANAAAMFIVGRFFLGLGGVLVGALGPVFIAELAYPSQRATATALSNTTYSAGAIIAAWITFGSFHIMNTWAWRLPSIFQAMPSLLQLVGVMLMPESPRWLISVGREDKALAILAEYHGNGDPDDEVVQFEYREIKETIEMEIASKKTSWKELYNTRGNRWRSFIMIWCGVCKQWSGNGLVSYYLGSMLKNAGIHTQLQSTLITATSQMFSFACSLAFAFLPARVGRRSLMLWSMALMWVVFSLITACSGIHNIGWTGAMMVYVVEVLPYAIRAKGIALFWLFTGICGAFNTYVNPLGLDAFQWKFYFFYVGWIAVQFVVVYLFFIETKGPSLEQIALLFDGKDAAISRENPVVDEILSEEKKDRQIEVEHVPKA